MEHAERASASTRSSEVERRRAGRRRRAAHGGGPSGGGSVTVTGFQEEIYPPEKTKNTTSKTEVNLSKQHCNLPLLSHMSAEFS